MLAGFKHEALLAQRNAVPLIGDLAAICRTPVVEDLYGKVLTPTGENLIGAYVHMISSVLENIRYYPRVTF